MSIESELGPLGERVEAVLNGSLYPNPNDRQRVLDKAMAEPVEQKSVYGDRLSGRLPSKVVVYQERE